VAQHSRVAAELLFISESNFGFMTPGEISGHFFKTHVVCVL
jgi:hypothetical protein